MDRANPTRRVPAIDRRRFLRGAGGLCGAAVAGAVLGPHPALAALAGVEEIRSLSFVHTHTGERLVTPYWRGGQYVPAQLERVNHFLRDFRTGDVHVIDPGLLDLLYRLQTLADRDSPFEVISGYRSPKTNAMLRARSEGVALHSMHMLGKAIDIRLDGYATRRLADCARSLCLGGVGFYARSDFVHVDTGRVRYW